MPPGALDEQKSLAVSIAITMVLGASGVVMGIYARSSAIVFDGMYSLVDVAITLTALWVARLIASEGSRRFQYGFWHLEPLMELFGGAALVLSCIYAAITALSDLKTGGGAEADFGAGLVWVLCTSTVGFVMAVVMRRAAKRTGSGLLALDARGWLVSGALSAGIAAGFVVALVLSTGRWSDWVRYADGGVLLMVSIAMLPVPIRGMVTAAKEVAQVASPDLDQRVSTITAAFIASQGLDGYSTYVAKAGRVIFVEVEILVQGDAPSGVVALLDALRDQLFDDLSGSASQVWLTVGVTSERKWL